jgi:hypothetical protein
MFLVLVKMDNGGSGIVACKELSQDPLFPNKVVLVGIQALSWPFQGQFLNVQQWSIDKDVVLNWMVGSLEQAPQLTEALLKGGVQEVPWPPGSKPSSDLVTDPNKFKQATQPPAPEPPVEPTPPPAAPPAPEPEVEQTALRPITIMGR